MTTQSMTRYKVEHCDTRNVWVPLHRGMLRSYQSALAKKQAFCRIMVDYLGNGVWEEIESLPHSAQSLKQWDDEKRSAQT